MFGFVTLGKKNFKFIWVLLKRYELTIFYSRKPPLGMQKVKSLITKHKAKLQRKP